jgi:hypothetical protein
MIVCIVVAGLLNVGIILLRRKLRKNDIIDICFSLIAFIINFYIFLILLEKLCILLSKYIV